MVEVKFGAHVFLLSLVVGVLLVFSAERALSNIVGDSSLSDVPAAVGEDVTVDGGGSESATESQQAPEAITKPHPRILTRADVTFLIDRLSALPVATCSDSASGVPGDVQMWEVAMAHLQTTLSAAQDRIRDWSASPGGIAVEVDTSAELAALRLEADVIEKAQFLTKSFRPDFSGHQTPALAYQRALVGYLRRALLH